LLRPQSSAQEIERFEMAVTVSSQAYRQGDAMTDDLARELAIKDASISMLQGAVRNAVGIRCGAFSGNMKVSFQAARSIG
jgi:hypothetical protein